MKKYITYLFYMLYFCKVGDTMEYRCPKCDAILNYSDNKYKCEYCRSEFDIKFFNNATNADYIIPFKITKDDAIKTYKKHIKSVFLTPSQLKKMKNINKIEGIYIPCYIYNLDSTGAVEFEGNKISTWKSSGTNYKKTDVYKVICDCNMSLKNMCVLATTQLEDNVFKSIEPYDYDKLVSFDPSYLQNYKVYKSDKTKEKLLDDIKSKAKDIFINKVSKEIKEYNELKNVDNSINLYNPNRKYVLLPIWILNIDCKEKKYTYIINGETGAFRGNIPIDIKKTIFIWLILFILIFIILLLLNLAQVIL